jgi:hypothetical protein
MKAFASMRRRNIEEIRLGIILGRGMVRQTLQRFRLQISLLVGSAILLLPVVTLATNRAIDLDQIWTGMIETAGFWGKMQLKLIQQGDLWKGETNFDISGTRVSGSARDLRIDDDKIVFSTDVQVMEIRFTLHFDGKRVGNKFEGVFSATRNDGTKTTGSWNLKLQGDSEPDRAPELPVPTGSYAVGRTSFFWKDASREEVMTVDPRDRREIMVEVWYPGEFRPEASPAPYFPDLDLEWPGL